MAQSVRQTVRTADGGTRTMTIGRKKAILLFCTECLGWETSPDDCTDVHCPLYGFRGKTIAAYHGDPKNTEESRRE